MVLSISGMPPASSIFSMFASISAFIMMVQTMLNQLVPRQVQHYVLDIISHYFKQRPDNNIATIVIEERDEMSNNEVYSAAETYLSTKIRPVINRLKISKRQKDTGLNIKFAENETVVDFYEGVELEWRFVNEEGKKTSKAVDEHKSNESEKRYFKLCFDKKYKDKVLDSYVPFVLKSANEIKAEKKEVIRLHTIGSKVWDSMNLEHPSTFDTLAMEPGQKKAIVEDLDRFVRRKDFYRKVGRAWKRGYLLYGPPGTGKSSLVAAIANYLKFDIYDLELSNVRRDTDLRNLLLRTSNRSILVIEDIDCTVELPDRKGLSTSLDGGHGYFPRQRDNQFTLAGLLNFIDGLWSSCADERIFIFTTNNKDKLEPALLRPGRMDMHIHMSYLAPDGFKLLASTYLNVDDEHPRLSEIVELIERKNVTPAEVAEELMKSDDVDTSLDGVVRFLENKNTDSDSMKDNEVDGDVDGDEDKKAKEVMHDDHSDIELVAH